MSNDRLIEAITTLIAAEPDAPASPAELLTLARDVASMQDCEAAYAFATAEQLTREWLRRIRPASLTRYLRCLR
jgi:hypothetical protein